MDLDYEQIRYDNNIHALEDPFVIKEYDSTKFTQMFDYKEQDEMADGHMGLVYQLCNRYAAGRKDYDDIMSAANAGLVKAIYGFDPRRNNKFTTFAHKCITNEIMFYMRSDKKDRGKSFLIDDFTQTDNNGKPVTLENMLSEGDYLPEEVAHEEVIEYLRKCIDKCLSKDDKIIIQKRYGLDTKTLTQLQISKLLHMSQANVSKRERNILFKLRLLIKTNLGDNIAL